MRAHISRPPAPDAQAMNMSAVPRAGQLPIGQKLTRGLGAGGNPDIGQARARACTPRARSALVFSNSRPRTHAAPTRTR
jgi:hypothetical protein